MTGGVRPSPRASGLSARVKLTLSYVVLVALAGALLLTVVWLYLLRYVPNDPLSSDTGWAPNQADLVRAFVPPATTAMVALVVFGAVGGWVLAGRMLAPLARLTEAARAADAGTLTRRVAMPGRRDEFRELADSFDGMLDRIEAHVAEQQRFAANASHELRTPLAITRTLLEVARSDPDADVAALWERLASVNERSIELVQALLLLSQADRGGLVREPVDLSLLVEDAAETLLSLAESRGVDLIVTGVPATACGSPTLLGQVAVNLMHNAIVHGDAAGRGDAASPRVTASTRDDGAEVVLTVENGGQMLTPEVVASLAEPFHRGESRVRRGDHDGVGLGLAIVVAIVRAHGGQVQLTPRAEGGLRVVVRLPQAPHVAPRQGRSGPD